MSKSREKDSRLWLWLFPIALIIHIYEDGFVDGFLRFAAFLYVGSFVLFIALLVTALFKGAVLAKAEMVLTGAIIILFSAFELAHGNVEALIRGAIFGGIVGTVLGSMFVFLLSSFAAKVRSAESETYSRIRSWFSGKQ